MKIISISDVITNSSSEVFILKSSERAEIVKELLLKVHKEGYGTKKDKSSGMGGILDIGDWTVFYISEAAKFWRIKKCMESGIEDLEDELTLNDVSKYYKKYSDIVENEFSYTVDDWLKAMNITKEDASKLIYLDSDHNQEAIRAYIKDSPIEIIGGEYYDMKEEKFPYPSEAYSMMDGKVWSHATMNDSEFAKYIIDQIHKSEIPTFMDYSEYLKTIKQ